MIFEDNLVAKVRKGKYGPRGMPGDIIQLKNGDLLLGYTKNGIAGRKSKNLGKTWGEEFTILPNPKKPQKQGTYAHPTFLRLADGDILMSYIYNTGAVPYQGHNYYRRSSDEANALLRLLPDAQCQAAGAARWAHHRAGRIQEALAQFE